MRRAVTLVVILLSSFFQANAAHPYSVTIVNADLREDRIILSIRTNAEDLLYFHKLEFDSHFKIPGDKLRAAALAHSQTIRSGFLILNQNKRPLSSALISSNLSSLDAAETFDVMSLLKFPLVYTLEFELNKTITLLEFNLALGTAGLPAVSFLTISRDTNVLAQNIELTKDKPFTMVRDAVSLRNPEENTFMLSYITVSDNTVIHELTAPFEILSSFVKLNNESSEETVSIIKGFIAESSEVEIDKKIVRPEITALVFQDGSASQGNKMMHVRIEYSLTALPKEVTISWENFNWKLRWFRSMVDAFGKKAEHHFSRFQPELRIERDVKIRRE
jgi:hypothetical protein